MEIEGVVQRIEGDEAVVEMAAPAGGCGRCDEPGGCRSGILTRPLGRSCRQFRLHNSLGARVGERVLVRIEDGATAANALSVYGLPVLGLLAGAAAGAGLPAGGDPDLAAATGGILGIGIGIGVLVRLRRRGRAGAGAAPVMAGRASIR